MNIQQRNAAFAECKRPSRYTSDPDVIDSPEETAKVKAEWDIYFAAMRAVEARFPYSDAEKAMRATTQ
jgi:hypothetical protein